MRLTKQILALLLLLSFQLNAQKPSDKEKLQTLFEQGLADYKNNKAEDALQKLQQVRQQSGASGNPQLKYRAGLRHYVYAKNLRDYHLSIDSITYYLKKFEELKDHLYIGTAQAYLADIYRGMGDVQTQIKLLYASNKSYEKIDHQIGIADNLQDLSLLHYDQDDLKSTRQTINRAIQLFKQYGTQRDLIGAYNNLSIIFEKSGPIDSAIYFQKIALQIAKREKYYESVGLLLSNLGNNYSAIGENELAEATLLKALKLRDSINDRHGMAYTNIRLCYFYGKINKPEKAIVHGERALAIAKAIPYLKAQRMAHGSLSIAYSQLNNPVKELYHYRREQTLIDSLQNLDNARSITRSVMNYEFHKKQLLDSIETAQREREQQFAFQKSLTAQKNQRNLFLILGIVAILMAFGLWNRLKFIRRTKAIIEKEKERSDSLLLNILPAEIAEELKEKGKAEARDFDMVSILFTDFKEFTQTSEKLSAKELVEEINICFEAFDRICEKHHIEKIKTIGDAYMAAGGLPVPSPSSVKNTVLAAIEMQEFIVKRKSELDTQYSSPLGRPGGAAFQMRVGIHTGPVVAGIVGVKKFQYDLWGDTVNTASRIENSCEAGKVNISQTTYELLKSDQDFAFESRGKIEAKGKGEIEMWFVTHKDQT